MPITVWRALHQIICVTRPKCMGKLRKRNRKKYDNKKQNRKQRKPRKSSLNVLPVRLHTKSVKCSCLCAPSLQLSLACLAATLRTPRHLSIAFWCRQLCPPGWSLHIYRSFPRTYGVFGKRPFPSPVNLPWLGSVRRL